MTCFSFTIHIHHESMWGRSHSSQRSSLREVSQYVAAIQNMFLTQLSRQKKRCFHCFYLRVKHVPLFTTHQPELVCKGADKKNGVFGEHYKFSKIRSFSALQRDVFSLWQLVLQKVGEEHGLGSEAYLFLCPDTSGYMFLVLGKLLSLSNPQLNVGIWV